MTKPRYENVKIPEEGRFKFVLIESLDDGEGVKLRGSFRSYHRDIANDAVRDEGLEGYVIGGGRIRVNPEQKTIYAYGESVAYGPAPQDLVEKLIEEYAKEKGYEWQVEMGVGY